MTQTPQMTPTIASPADAVSATYARLRRQPAAQGRDRAARNLACYLVAGLYGPTPTASRRRGWAVTAADGRRIALVARVEGTGDATITTVHEIDAVLVLELSRDGYALRSAIELPVDVAARAGRRGLLGGLHLPTTDLASIPGAVDRTSAVAVALRD